MEKIPANRHHIIPSSRNGSGKEINLPKVKIPWHVLLHRVFRNAVTHEKIEEMLCWEQDGLSTHTRSNIERVLHEALKQNCFYRPEAYNRHLSPYYQLPRGDEETIATRLFTVKRLRTRLIHILEWDSSILQEPPLHDILNLLSK